MKMFSNRNKKGIFFTLIAVSLLGIMLFTFGVTYSYSLHEKSAIIETRVDTMNRFLQTVDDDMQNAIYISGYRSMVALTDYLVTNGSYVTDSEAALTELFMNSTVEGYEHVFMANNTFPNWTTKIAGKGSEIGINISVSILSLSVYHTSPWNVRFSVESEINLSDQKSTANWSKQKSLYSDISIIGFEDPWYPLHTNGVVNKRINQSIHDGNFSQGNDTSNLNEHIANTYYIAFNASPSFLMRFDENYSTSPYGIESLVNKTDVLNYCSISTSSTDHICWQKNTSITTWRVTGINSTAFRLDNETNDAGIGRVERYGLEDVVY
ncbi:hypothetical protein ACFL3V_02200 [Nanoarchaeota archaeon]